MAAGARRALRWYPPAWRARYGEELLAMLDDTYGDGPLPWQARLSLLRTGSVERLREAGLRGSATPPSAGVRAGAFLALWGWAFFMVAGAGFWNRAEGWRPVVPAEQAGAPLAGYATVAAAGVGGVLLVLAGALLCAPTFVRFLRAGGWAAIRRPVLRAVLVTALTVVAFGVTKVWATHLTQLQRDGADAGYGVVFLCAAACAAACIACWAAAGAATLRRMDLSPSLLRACARLTAVLTVLMVAVLAGTVTWWAALTTAAPLFMSGGGYIMGALVALMAAGLVLGAAGARRAATSRRRMT